MIIPYTRQTGTVDIKEFAEFNRKLVKSVKGSVLH